MLTCYLEAVGLASPGLPKWEESLGVLRGNENYTPTPLEKYRPELLPANERRRATELVRMAFRVCEDLVSGSQINLTECASVFASSGGDYPIIDQICRTLCTPERMVSPTQFHNSVHNSAAGYWSIATGSRKASTSISCYDHSFIAGLVEAFCLCITEQIPTLLVTYDIKPPSPLNQKREIPIEFGVALLLSPNQSKQSSARLQLDANPNAPTTTCVKPELELLRCANPAARSLPLLALLAQQKSGAIVLDALDQNPIRIQVEPCY